jgi:putative membrane protein
MRQRVSLQPLRTEQVVSVPAMECRRRRSIMPLEKIMPHINPVQIQKFLKGVDYPASKSALIEKAKSMGADENVCASLEQLPEEDFQTPADVSQAFGKLSDQPERSSSSSGSNEFLAEAVQDAMAEIHLCELAIERTSNEEIKVFSQTMIDDHSKMGQEIEQLCSRKNIDLPKDVNSAQSSTMQQLLKLSGIEFDRQFIDHNVKEHEKNIKIFQHYADQERDAQIRLLAEKGAKTLARHLEMAKRLGTSLH